MDPILPTEPSDEGFVRDLPTEEEMEAAGLAGGDGESDDEGVAQEPEAEAPPTPEPDVDPTLAPEVEIDPTLAPEAGAERPAPGTVRKKPAQKKPPKPRRTHVVEAPKVTLPPEHKAEARTAAFERITNRASRSPAQLGYALDALDAGLSVVFLARFRRAQTAGLDERTLRALRDDWKRVREEEEHRVSLRELLRQRGGLTPEREQALEGRALDARHGRRRGPVAARDGEPRLHGARPGARGPGRGDPRRTPGAAGAREAGAS